MRRTKTPPGIPEVILPHVPTEDIRYVDPFEVHMFSNTEKDSGVREEKEAKPRKSYGDFRYNPQSHRGGRGRQGRGRGAADTSVAVDPHAAEDQIKDDLRRHLDALPRPTKRVTEVEKMDNASQDVSGTGKRYDFAFKTAEAPTGPKNWRYWHKQHGYPVSFPPDKDPQMSRQNIHKARDSHGRVIPPALPWEKSYNDNAKKEFDRVARVTDHGVMWLGDVAAARGLPQTSPKVDRKATKKSKDVDEAEDMMEAMEIRKMFDLFDTRHENEISVQGMKEVMDDLGEHVPDEEVAALFRACKDPVHCRDIPDSRLTLNRQEFEMAMKLYMRKLDEAPG